MTAAPFMAPLIAGFFFAGALLTLEPSTIPVGASLLAMEVNDDAGSLTPHGALRFFVGTPPGASSLLQSPPPSAIHGRRRLTRGGLPVGLFAGVVRL